MTIACRKDGLVAMSRTTASIMRINEQLDRISGLDGVVADRIEEEERKITAMVDCILKNHSEASIFDYNGSENSKTNLDHIREMDDYDLANFIYDIARSNGRNLNLCDGCECKCSGSLPCDETERYYEYLYKEYDGE